MYALGHFVGLVYGRWWGGGGGWERVARGTRLTTNRARGNYFIACMRMLSVAVDNDL